MDLSFIHENQETVAVQKLNNFDGQLFKYKENHDETDVNGKISSFKTDHSNTVLKDANEKVEVDSLFSYSSFKKAMDLRTHNRNDEKKRTIFEDADYFSRNYLYKLLPITFESVNEAIIHTEHNYCHFFMSSESDVEEDCSRTMDYSQIKEKNYKRRKMKVNENGIKSDNGDSERYQSVMPPSVPLQENHHSEETHSSALQSFNHSTTFPCTEESCSQPLDLSPPLVQERKTDNCLREHQANHNSSLEEKEEFDSDKENLKSKLRCIEVTITRPDEKENYEPCDLFLNDIARMVPRLIGKDCFEVDILDKTCKRYDKKHRLYYIISESTWQLFKSARERVILTNDPSLGQFVQDTEKSGGRPSFLVFDQVSLAQCLSDFCEETGGSFEYTSLEEIDKVKHESEAVCENQVREEKIEGKSEIFHSSEINKKYLTSKLKEALNGKIKEKKPQIPQHNEDSTEVLKNKKYETKTKEEVDDFPQETTETTSEKLETTEEKKDLKETEKATEPGKENSEKETKDSIKSTEIERSVIKTRSSTKKSINISDEKLKERKTESEAKLKGAVIETKGKGKEVGGCQEKPKNTTDEKQKVSDPVIADTPEISKQIKTSEEEVIRPKRTSRKSPVAAEKIVVKSEATKSLVAKNETNQSEKEENLKETKTKKSESGVGENLKETRTKKLESGVEENSKETKRKKSESDVGENSKETRRNKSESGVGENLKETRTKKLESNVEENSKETRRKKSESDIGENSKETRTKKSESDVGENSKETGRNKSESNVEVPKAKDSSEIVGKMKKTLKRTTAEAGESPKKSSKLTENKDLVDKKKDEEQLGRTTRSTKRRNSVCKRNQSTSENPQQVVTPIQTRSKSISEIPSQKSSKRKVPIKLEPSKKSKKEATGDMKTRSGKVLGGNKTKVVSACAERGLEIPQKVMSKRKRR